MDYTFFREQTSPRGKTASAGVSGEAALARTRMCGPGRSSAAGRAAKKGGTRAYRDVFMACLLTGTGLLMTWFSVQFFRA